MKRKAQPGKTSAYSSLLTLAYVGTLALYLLAAMFHPHDLWSVNWWAFYPAPVPIGLFIVGLVLVYGVSRLKSLAGRNDISDGRHQVLASVVVFLFCVLFWLLRAQTHYLGDGYQLLSRLAADNPIIKPWNFGGIALPYGLSRILGDGSESAVLLSYQVISIASGLILALVTIWAARRLLGANIDRLLFLLGVMTAGTSLLFFGYVENYSLFVVSVYTFGLAGLLVGQGKASRFWILPLFVLTVFFHIFGLILLPALIYLLASGSRLGERVAAASETVKVIAGIVALIAGVAAFWYLYSHYYFFRFSFVPLIQDRFTVDGYALFSGQHLLDWLSLLVLFVPGLVIAIAAIRKGSWRASFKRREIRFLAILLVCCLGAVFLLDPKLGMPRDWDLFSFAGVPLVLLAFYALLQSGGAVEKGRRGATLVIGVGLLVLLPRAFAQTDREFSWNHLRSYFAHDPAKCFTIRSVWVGQLEDWGDSDLAAAEMEAAKKIFPESGLEQYGWELLREGEYPKAIECLEKVVEINPLRSKSWSGIGFCYVQLRQSDTALTYFRISDGLTPYRPFTYDNMGYALFNTGQYEAAEEHWRKAWEMDTSLVDPLVALCKHYSKFRDVDNYNRTFFLLASRKQAPLDLVAGQIRTYLEQGQVENGRHAFALLVKNFPEVPEVKNLLKDFPELDRPSP